MGRPIDLKLHEERRQDLEKAAQNLLEKKQRINKTTLAKESGLSRQALNSGYLSEIATEIITRYNETKIKNIEWSDEEWKEKYERLRQRFDVLENKYRATLDALKQAKNDNKALQAELEQLRGTIFLDRKKHSV